MSTCDRPHCPYCTPDKRARNERREWRCQGCGKWMDSTLLCSNEETHRLECRPCYDEWHRTLQVQNTLIAKRKPVDFSDPLDCQRKHRLGYLDFFQDAEEREVRGEVQTFCGRCARYRWQEELCPRATVIEGAA